MPPSFVILGNPENRRVTMFQEALARQKQRPARVIPWIDLTEGPEAIERALDRLPEEPLLVRIDSFGEDYTVDQALLARGYAEMEKKAPSAWRVTPEEARSAAYDRGRIYAPRQEHLGFLSVLAEVKSALASRPWLEVLNAPESIERLFDKRACAKTFARVGVPMARPLPGQEEVRTPAELRERMTAARMHRVFVKLTCGSSASCLALYEHHPQRRRDAWLFTSMEIDGERLYNSLRPRRYRDSRSIERILTFLLNEGSHVEEHVAKARLERRFFDTRMLTIDGEVAFTVVRTSPHPVTNLHLGGTRGTIDDLESVIPRDVIEQAHESCAKVFRDHDCLHIGVDVMFTAAADGHCVVEANAFGDLLPNLERDGLSVYEWEIRAALEKSAR